MNPERWNELSPYLDHVLALGEDGREAWARVTSRTASRSGEWARLFQRFHNLTSGGARVLDPAGHFTRCIFVGDR